MNNNAKKDRADKTLTIGEHNTLIQQEQKDWDPQSMMMILDSLEAIRWAWILIQISSQDTIDTYINRFVQLTRKNPQRLPNVKEAWDTFSWNIALEMRNNKTFKQATEEILQDPVTLADILSQPLKKKSKGDPTKPTPRLSTAYPSDTSTHIPAEPDTTKPTTMESTQRIIQGHQRQAILWQEPIQVPEQIGTAQRLGDSIPIS